MVVSIYFHLSWSEHQHNPSVHCFGGDPENHSIWYGGQTFATVASDMNPFHWLQAGCAVFLRSFLKLPPPELDHRLLRVLVAVPGPRFGRAAVLGRKQHGQWNCRSICTALNFIRWPLILTTQQNASKPLYWSYKHVKTSMSKHEYSCHRV